MSSQPIQRIKLLAATVFGVGYAPVASGTFGSIPGVVLYALTYRLAGTPAVLAAIVAVTAVGLWSAGAAESHFGKTDPGPVVIDEVAGQLVTLCFWPATLPLLFAGFFWFRLMDVLKPFPARRLERLHGAAGIMTDDLVAGVYANLALWLSAWIAPGWLGLS